jgi:Matrixin
MLGADDNLDTTKPDPNASYEDLVFGGAGLDVLLGNTGGDRLIDWQGEFNTFIVPFNPFGLGTVSRLIAPSLPEFLYALSKSEGADQTLAAQHSSSAARNGEPFGELGLIQQEDAAWGDQNAGPRDPQSPTYKNSKDIKSTDGTRLFDAAPAWVAPAPLTAASAPESPVAASALTPEQLAPMVAAATELWLATGLTTDQLLRLEQTRVEIADLDGLYLGVTQGVSVTIDVDAAGWGWSAGGIDLFTVVAHELGHAIGLDHADHGVMEPTIGVGQRELPEATSVGSAASPSTQALSAPTLAAAAPAVALSVPDAISSDGATLVNVIRARTLMRPSLLSLLTIRLWPHRRPWRSRTRHGQG